MDNAPKNESEKIKKTRATSAKENNEIENVKNEKKMENNKKDHRKKEDQLHSERLHSPPFIFASSEPESEETLDLEQLKEERRKAILKMKWATVTGKKPSSIPITKSYKSVDTEDVREESFFGERRPADIERRRKENWMRLERLSKTEIVFKNEAKILAEIRFPMTYGGLSCLRFLPEGENLVTGFGNGMIQIRKADTGEVVSVLKQIDCERLRINALRPHPVQNTKIYAAGQAGIIYVYDILSETCIDFVSQENNEISNVDLSPDGLILATGGQNGNLYLYDPETLKIIKVYERPEIEPFTKSDIEDLYHKMRIFAVKFHPMNPNIIVTGGWDNTVKVWDPRENQAILSIKGPRICGDAVDVRETEILTASWTVEDSLKLWDLTSGNLIKQITVGNRSRTVEGEFYYAAKFLTKEFADRDLIVAGGNGCGAVEVIDIQNDMVVGSFPSMKAVIALDNHDSVIAYGGMESVLRIGELNPDI